MRRVSICLLLLLAAGCTVPIVHRPTPAPLDIQAARRQVEYTLLRARFPRSTAVEITADVVVFGQRAPTTPPVPPVIIGGGFASGAVAGAYVRQLRESRGVAGTQIVFQGVGEVEVYKNAYVFVKDPDGQLITKILFASLYDAKLFADALLTLKHLPQEPQNPLKAQENIPLVKVGGVYTLPVTLNRVLTLHFILDTGASEVFIPADVALTLVRTGTIQDADFLPGADYTLADGSVISSPRFVIRSLTIGGREITDVPASIGTVSSSLLIGQNVLERFGTWGIDNTHKVLVLGVTDPSESTRASEVMSLAGHWRGAWGSSRVAAGGSLTAALRHARFALTGHVRMTQSLCFGHGEVYGTVIGEGVVLRVDFGHGQWADLTGTVSADGKDMRGHYLVNGGPCGDDVGTWSFTSM